MKFGYKMSPRAITILVSIGIYCLAGIVLWVGLHLRRRALTFLKNSVEGLGTVIAMEQSASYSSEGPVYHPVVSYKDSRGMLFTLRATAGVNPPPCKVGAPWPVFFSADEPQKAKLGPRKAVLYPSRACIVGGVILLVFGTIAWLVFP